MSIESVYISGTLLMFYVLKNVEVVNAHVLNQNLFLSFCIL